MRVQPFDADEIPREHLTGVARRQLRFVAHVSYRPYEGRGVQASKAGNVLGERDVVRLGLLPMEPEHGPEQHHHRAETRRDELELPLAIRAGQ